MADSNRPKKIRFGGRNPFANLLAWLSNALSKLFDRLTGRGWAKRADELKEGIRAQQADLKETGAAFDEIMNQTQNDLDVTRERAGLSGASQGAAGPASINFAEEIKNRSPDNPEDTPNGAAKVESEEAAPAATGAPLNDVGPDNEAETTIDTPSATVETPSNEEAPETHAEATSFSQSDGASKKTEAGQVVHNTEPLANLVGLSNLSPQAWSQDAFQNILSAGYWELNGSTAQERLGIALQDKDKMKNIAGHLKTKAAAENGLASLIFEYHLAKLGPDLKEGIKFARESGSSLEGLYMNLYEKWQKSQACAGDMLTGSPEKFDQLIEALQGNDANKVSALLDGFHESLGALRVYDNANDGIDIAKAHAWREAQSQLYDEQCKGGYTLATEVMYEEPRVKEANMPPGEVDSESFGSVTGVKPEPTDQEKQPEPTKPAPFSSAYESHQAEDEPPKNEDSKQQEKPSVDFEQMNF